VNIALKFLVPRNDDNSLLAEQLLAFREEPYSIELEVGYLVIISVI
jgi:hypothetical protein